jgi:hypothetical protein
LVLPAAKAVDSRFSPITLSEMLYQIV